jgi:hypothetical protein
MKKMVVAGSAMAFAVIASAVVIMTGAGRQASDPGRSARPADQSKSAHDSAALETIRGQIVELPDGGRGSGDGKGPGAKGPSAPLITIRSATETVRVHAGPPRYHKEIGLVLAEQDSIEVTGTREGVGAKAVLVAQSIKQGDRVFRIRGENGEKLWQPNQQKPEVVLSTISGEIVDLAPETADNVPGRERSGMLIGVRSAAGKIAVQLGPESFRTEHGLILAIGDRVDVSGWQLPGAVVAGTPLMLAASIRKGDQELRIRDEQRRALWSTK